jgi:predicted dehydrogenase
MTDLKFALFGAGFWARYQLAAWRELKGAECVAIYNRTHSKAEALAREFRVPAVYDDPEKLLDTETLDFIDIVTDVDTHAPFVQLAARHGTAVICQKPMAPTLEAAREMVAVCRDAGVPYFIHENWRWQTPIRELARVLASGAIGTPFRARIDMISGFPLFVNQPFLKELEQFIITDIGSHVLDTARFLFGEATRLYCSTRRVHTDIKGEDVATVMMEMGGRTTVVCNMAYAGNPLEREAFPQTFFFVEGDRGSAEIGPDYWLRVTTEAGTYLRRVPPPRYAWADPAYDVVHASIVACHANLLVGMRGEATAETTGEDNLKTVKLVFAAYESAARGEAILF